MTLALKAWGPSVLWAAVLFLLSEVQPAEAATSWLPMGDKVAHLGLYAVLGITLAWGERTVARSLPLTLLALGVAYGGLDEWHQSFVPGRDPSLGDLFADAVGVSLGFFLLRLYFQARAPRGPKPNTIED